MLVNIRGFPLSKHFVFHEIQEAFSTVKKIVSFLFCLQIKPLRVPSILRQARLGRDQERNSAQFRAREILSWQRAER